jgi:hypothetical protein
MAAGEGGSFLATVTQRRPENISRKEKEKREETQHRHTHAAGSDSEEWDTDQRRREWERGERQWAKTQGSGGGVRMADMCSVCIRMHAGSEEQPTCKLQEVNTRDDERRCHFPFDSHKRFTYFSSLPLRKPRPAATGECLCQARKQGHQIGPGGQKPGKRKTKKVSSGQAELIPAAAPPRRGNPHFYREKVVVLASIRWTELF